MMIALAACTCVVGSFLAILSPMADELRDIFNNAGISDSYLNLIFKAMAICLITQITSELCRDRVECAIASAAEIWGRGAIAYISLPLIRTLLQQIAEII